MKLQEEVKVASDLLLVETLRECISCKSQKNKTAGSQSVATVGTQASGKRAKQPKEKGSRLNRALDRAYVMTKKHKFGKSYLEAVHLIFNPNIRKVCWPTIAQLQYRLPVALRLSPLTVRKGEAAVTPSEQHMWLPSLKHILSMDGTPVFPVDKSGIRKGETISTEEDNTICGWSPKNPLHLSVHGMNNGGMIATPAVALGTPGEDMWSMWTEQFCYLAMADTSTFSSLSNEELRAYAKCMKMDCDIEHEVRALHNKRLSNVKTALVRGVCEMLGFESATNFNEFLHSSIVLEADRSYVLSVLGCGGNKSPGEYPKTYEDWSSRDTASFSKWRTMTPATLKQMRVIGQQFLDSANIVSSPRLHAKKGLEVAGTDILFNTPMAREIYCTFMNRNTLPCNTNDKSQGNPSVPKAPVVTGKSSGAKDEAEAEESGPRYAQGDSSVLTLARADAYIAAWLTIIAECGKSSRKIDSSRLIQYPMRGSASQGRA